MSLVFPLTVDHLAVYISHLYDSGYAASTITSFVSAISFVHKLLQVSDPSQSFVIKKILNGCRKVRSTQDSRLPISPHILAKLVHASRYTVSSLFSRLCFQAMCTLAFHAMLRIGEMTVSHNNLTLDCMQLENDALTIQFRHYKHSKGVPSYHVVKAQPSSQTCPVRHMQQYLQARGKRPGPLFITEAGEGVSRKLFCSDLNVALTFSGYHDKRYTSHSFRIGAASFMASQGASDAQIRQAGRWASNAFLTYIRHH